MTQEVIVVNPASTSVVVVSGTAVGPQGATGLTGSGYSNVTSTTSQSVTTGSKTFALTTVLGYHAFVVGQRVRVIYDTSNFVEGTITAVSASSMTVNVTLVTGSGTYTAWTFTVAGAPGAVGATGSTGATGPTGITIAGTAPANLNVLWADTSTVSANVAVFDGGTPSAQLTSIKTRRGLATTWSGVNPVLDAGEFGYESDTTKFKIGTGALAWNSLSYASGVTPASTVTGTTLATNVVNSSLTTFGTSPTITTPNISSPTLTGTINMTGATVTGGTFDGGSA